jgi:hypothetical protein
MEEAMDFKRVAAAVLIIGFTIAISTAWAWSKH